MINNCNNEWGQFVDLECGRLVPDKKTGLIVDTYNKPVIDRNKPYYPTKSSNFTFTTQCVVGMLYSLTYIINSLLPDI
jgi:hypothetical protein